MAYVECLRYWPLKPISSCVFARTFGIREWMWESRVVICISFVKLELLRLRITNAHMKCGSFFRSNSHGMTNLLDINRLGSVGTMRKPLWRKPILFITFAWTINACAAYRILRSTIFLSFFIVQTLTDIISGNFIGIWKDEEYNTNYRLPNTRSTNIISMFLAKSKSDHLPFGRLTFRAWRS